jgi:hypothetical protein
MIRPKEKVIDTGLADQLTQKEPKVSGVRYVLWKELAIFDHKTNFNNFWTLFEAK